MKDASSLTIKVFRPFKSKEQELNKLIDSFRRGVTIAFDDISARPDRNLKAIKKSTYHAARSLKLPAGYALSAATRAVSLYRAGQRPTAMGHEIDLGVDVYQLVCIGPTWLIQIATLMRRKPIVIPMHVPPKFAATLHCVRGVANLYRYRGDWYVKLPVHNAIDPEPPVASIDDISVIGIDVGVVRHATVVTPDCVRIFDGRAHRKRYQTLINKTKFETRLCNWATDVNHKTSSGIIALAREYACPVLVIEKLSAHMLDHIEKEWPIRQLITMLRAKASAAGIPMIYVNPCGTSRTCPRCNHATRANNPKNGGFRCVRCRYQGNSDIVAARNIASRGREVFLTQQSSQALDCTGGPTPSRR